MKNVARASRPQVPYCHSRFSMRAKASMQETSITLAFARVSNFCDDMESAGWTPALQRRITPPRKVRTPSLRILLTLCLIAFLFAARLGFAAQVAPVLNFPEAGMDDPARYKDYVTRFYRDSSKNAVEVYMNRTTGRTVNLWADSANESISFTTRSVDGAQALLQWCSDTADVTNQADRRFVEYYLCSASTSIEIGHILLGTMRKERDFQYFKKDQLPFDSEPFLEPELLGFITNVDKLPEDERAAELKMLQAQTTGELRHRMEPVITQNGNVISAEQPSFDGKNHLWLELDAADAVVKLNPRSITISSGAGKQIRVRVKVGTDSASLTPLDREEIFNDAFLKFYADMKERASSSAQAGTDFRWIDREVRGMELVSYHEKLMAGLPNFATYFGRDTMMSAFMFTPIWSDDMLQHSIESVLRKLSPHGDASHEEALGGQAIRENAGEYNKLIEQYLSAGASADPVALQQARDLVSNLQKVRENYRMIDDDFQLPILIGRFLSDPKVAIEKKNAFVENRLGGVLKNLAYVCRVTRPFVEHPDALHLMSFPKEGDRWISSSWRDSGAGYAGGRFAMDVNVIFVPNALQSISSILEFLQSNGTTPQRMESLLSDMPAESRAVFMQYVNNPSMLQDALRAWRRSIQFFWVQTSRDEYLPEIQAKLRSLPENEQAFWKTILAANKKLPDKLEFLALSLDETGKPVKVINTDPATKLFLEDHTRKILIDHEQPGEVYKLINSFLISYPLGLFVENLGPLCANDAHASPDVWATFEKDQYHSPRVVWGREANLMTLGLMKEIVEAQNTRDQDLNLYVKTLQAALTQIRTAVESSGLKHNELWSYEIRDGKLMPVRYGSSSDIQLWNLTDLSIQFLANQMKKDNSRKSR